VKILRSAFTATLLIGLLSSHASLAQPKDPPKAPQKPGAAADAPAAANEKVTPEEAKKRQDWRDQMLKKPAPKKGCFNAAYPKTDWQEVPCGTAPNIPAGPRKGPRPATIGNGADISARAPTGNISQAIGHFENVTNVTSETGQIANAGAQIANTYTLQINTDWPNGGASTACTGHPGCRGWEQWIFWNTGTSSGYAAEQYWLIGYNAACPAGWNTAGTSCWRNATNAVTIPNQPITNMANWRFTGTATATGDSITLSTGTNVYTATGDNSVGVSTIWTIAEFNIFGYGSDAAGNGATANFNTGAQADVRTEIIYGGTNAPTCSATGYTAEMNNLNFGPTAPAATVPGPAVIFQESTPGGATGCAAASTIGDTHLRTFNGLFYDFQAAGDFTLAEVAPGFEVQTRQVSGAPTWPDATVNKAVAARFGKIQVVICGGPEPRVFLDKKLTALGDGQAIELGDGGVLRRQGNVYDMVGEDGNSVRATTNAYSNTYWIDVNVGLGQWPSEAKGLIANVKGNVNQIATRDNFVLTNPFNFDELYHRFADSWRVAADASMLSACNAERVIEVGAPKRAFFANDLEAGVREKARGVCTAAGVKAGALLDACTLDVAVIGQDAAAKVFVDFPAPAVVGIIAGGGATGGGGGGGILETWWWLILLLLALILIVWLMMRKKP
jgi:hypothetical protein